MASIQTIKWRERTDPKTGTKVKYDVPRAQWRFEARWVDPKGKHCHKRFPQKGDAVRYLQKIGVSIQDGDYVDPKLARERFDTWADIYWRSTIKLAERTRAGYWQKLRHDILPYFSGMEIGAIDHADIVEFISHQFAKGHSPKTVRESLSIVKRIMDGPMRAKVRRDNPAMGHRIEQRKKPLEVPSLREFKNLVAVVQDPYKPAVRLLFETGIRPSELSGLQVGDVDFIGHEVSIVRTLTPVAAYEGKKQRLVEGPPKTDAGYRKIPLDPSLCEDLAAMLAARAAASGAPVGRDEWLFVQPKGGPLDQRWFRLRVIVPALRAAGLPLRTRTYLLRHAHATHVIDQGASLPEAAQRMGHSDPSVTLRVYAHVLEGSQQAITDRLAAALRAVDAEPSSVVEMAGRRPASPPRARMAVEKRREEVARLAAEGLSMYYIGSMVGVSQQTVKRDLDTLSGAHRSAQKRKKTGSEGVNRGQQGSAEKAG